MFKEIDYINPTSIVDIKLYAGSTPNTLYVILIDENLDYCIFEVSQTEAVKFATEVAKSIKKVDIDFNIRYTLNNKIVETIKKKKNN